MYSKQDLKQIKSRGISKDEISKQLKNFEEGFKAVKLIKPATLQEGIEQINDEQILQLLSLYQEANQKRSIIKMIPASGSATRMFKDLYEFMADYKGDVEDYLQFLVTKGSGTMHDFFLRLDEFAFYGHLRDRIKEKGDDLDILIDKKDFNKILFYILEKKGLNYGDTPKGLVDFHLYRDFARTPFDEHLVEGALYANQNGKINLHFTVSENYLSLFEKRMRKVKKVFEKMFSVKYDITFSCQKPETDTVSVDEQGNLVRNSEEEILFRPAGHGALLHNLSDLKGDFIFIKNIDNVTPDRLKTETIKYKQLLAAKLYEIQVKVFHYLEQLDKWKVSSELLDEIELFIVKDLHILLGERYKSLEKKERIKAYHHLLNRPLRVCGMVRNEGEPGGGPFFALDQDGNGRLMIIESAQVDCSDEQQQVFKSATHFNPVDIICTRRDYKNKRFDLTKYVDTTQGFIAEKSYKGQKIKVQELPGLWNGSMANWNTIFIEVPSITFTPVKTVFDLLRIEHRNVIRR